MYNDRLIDFPCQLKLPLKPQFLDIMRWFIPIVIKPYLAYCHYFFVQALLFQVFMRCFSLPLLPVALFSVVLGIYLPWCLYKWLHQGNKGLFKRFISLMSGD